MQITHSWHLPSLCSKKGLLILSFLLVFIASASAQSNYKSRSSKKYYFGITLSYAQMNYNLIRNSKFQDLDNVIYPDTTSTYSYYINSEPKGGLGVNIVTNLKIGQYIDVRALPGFLFSEKSIDYFIPTPISPSSDFDELASRDFTSVYFSMPLQVRIKSEPYKDIRGYFLVGGNYMTDIQSKSPNGDDQDYLQFSANEFEVEGGFGFQFFFKYFILSPEFKVSYGLNNALQSTNGYLSTYIDSMKSRRFTFSLHFEG